MRVPLCSTDVNATFTIVFNEAMTLPKQLGNCVQGSRGEIRENQMQIEVNTLLNWAYVTASRECDLSDITVWFALFLVGTPFEAAVAVKWQ